MTNTIKTKVDVKFPANVTAVDPILLDRTGGNYTFGFDMDTVIDILTPLFAPPDSFQTVFASRAVLIASSFPLTAPMGSRVTVLGYATPGDTIPFDYIRVASAPTHAGKATSSGGTVFWELARDQTLRPSFVGVPLDGVTDATAKLVDFAGVLSAFVTCEAQGDGVYYNIFSDSTVRGLYQYAMPLTGLRGSELSNFRFTTTDATTWATGIAMYLSDCSDNYMSYRCVTPHDSVAIYKNTNTTVGLYGHVRLDNGSNRNIITGYAEGGVNGFYMVGTPLTAPTTQPSNHNLFNVRTKNVAYPGDNQGGGDDNTWDMQVENAARWWFPYNCDNNKLRGHLKGYTVISPAIDLSASYGTATHKELTNVDIDVSVEFTAASGTLFGVAHGIENGYQTLGMNGMSGNIRNVRAKFYMVDPSGYCQGFFSSGSFTSTSQTADANAGIAVGEPQNGANLINCVISGTIKGGAAAADFITIGLQRDGYGVNSRVEVIFRDFSYENSGNIKIGPYATVTFEPSCYLPAAVMVHEEPYYLSVTPVSGTFTGFGTIGGEVITGGTSGAQHYPRANQVFGYAAGTPNTWLKTYAGLYVLNGEGSGPNQLNYTNGETITETYTRTIPYTFSTTTTQADPGNGVLRFNNATTASVTNLWADLLDNTGVNWTTILQAGGATTVTISKVSDPTKFITFNINSFTTQTGYEQITVTFVSQSGASPFANGDALSAVFGGYVGATGTINAAPTGGLGFTNRALTRYSNVILHNLGPGLNGLTSSSPMAIWGDNSGLAQQYAIYTNLGLQFSYDPQVVGNSPTTAAVVYGQVLPTSTGLNYNVITGKMHQFTVNNVGAINLDATAFYPSTDGAITHGKLGQAFGGAFYKVGAVLNFGNTVFATHAANSLAFTGLTSGWSFDGTGTITQATGAQTLILTSGAASSNKSYMEMKNASTSICRFGIESTSPPSLLPSTGTAASFVIGTTSSAEVQLMTANTLRWTIAVGGAFIGTITTDSSSTGSGAIQTLGGAGIAKALTVGTSIKPGSYTVATLLTGSAGMIVFCSNVRVFNGAGVQEGAGSGTGGLVQHNGTAWKIAGTNVTAIA